MKRILTILQTVFKNFFSVPSFRLSITSVFDNPNSCLHLCVIFFSYETSIIFLNYSVAFKIFLIFRVILPVQLTPTISVLIRENLGNRKPAFSYIFHVVSSTNDPCLKLKNIFFPPFLDGQNGVMKNFCLSSFVPNTCFLYPLKALQNLTAHCKQMG